MKQREEVFKEVLNKVLKEIEEAAIKDKGVCGECGTVLNGSEARPLAGGYYSCQGV